MEQAQTITHAAPPFSMGTILKKAFAVFSQKPLVFIGLTAITAAPELVSTTVVNQLGTLNFVFSILTIALSFMLQAAVAYGTYQVMLRREPAFGVCLSRGMARFVPLLLVSLLMIAAVATLAIATMWFGAFGIFVFVAIILSLGARWLVTIPACVIEQLSPVESLNRSATLTEGYRWPVLALFLLSMTAIFGASFVLGLMSTATTGFTQASSFIIALVGCIPKAFQSVMIAVIYHDLRVAKEGVSVETLVSVFE